jgi:hypothetical protein
MVQKPLLATPRWSVRGQTETPFKVVLGGITPTAGLVEEGRMVSVHLHFHDLRHAGNTLAETSDVALDASFDTLCNHCPIRHLGSWQLSTAN